MNRPVACSSVMKRWPPLSGSGRRMKRSIVPGTRISAFMPRPSLARASCSAMVKPRLGMNGNGCAGSIASGVSTGKMCCRKWSSSQAFSALVTSAPSTRTMFSLRRSSRSARPARLLVGREAADRLADAHELLGRRQPVRALLDDALAHLVLQAGDAHHEEFVEVVGRNGQEPQPLQHRMVLVLGLLQHPAVEVQPGEFPVDEPLGAGGEVMQRHDGRGRASARRDAEGGFFLQDKGFAAVCHDRGTWNSSTKLTRPYVGSVT